MKISVSHQESFSAAHRLFNPAWSGKRNKDTFGLCNNPHYHGHNYRLVVTLSGEPHPETGQVYSVTELKEAIAQAVIEPFGGKNLNRDVRQLEQLNPTAEHIAMALWYALRPHFEDRYRLQVMLYETERNFVAYPYPAL